MVEFLSSKCRALCLIPSTGERRRGDRERRESKRREEARIATLCFFSQLDISKGQLKLPNFLPVQRYLPPRLPYCDGLDLLIP